MNIFAYLVIGLIVGCIASAVVEKNGSGPFGDITVGIIGALIGGYGFNLLGSSLFGIFDSLVASALGAGALLIMVRTLIEWHYSKNPWGKM